MNLIGQLPPRTNDAQWSADLRTAEFDVPAISRYSIKYGDPGLIFGFTAFDVNTIRSAFDRMKKVLHSFA
jgi:hypothetical protein